VNVDDDLMRMLLHLEMLPVAIDRGHEVQVLRHRLSLQSDGFEGPLASVWLDSQITLAGTKCPSVEVVVSHFCTVPMIRPAVTYGRDHSILDAVNRGSPVRVRSPACPRCSAVRAERVRIIVQ
jgi:hypothetical protein